MNIFNNAISAALLTEFQVSSVDRNIGFNPVSDIYIGDIRELGAAVKYPKISVLSTHTGDITTANRIIFRVQIDLWCNKQNGGRTALNILYAVCRSALHNTNWTGTGAGFKVLRSWEEEWSDRLYEADLGLFHGAALYTVWAKSNQWK